jgi:hypothetical protein
MPDFRMTIKDIFRFRDGTTVFVGPINGPSCFVSSCECQLYVDGTLRQDIYIEGEMIPDRPHAAGYRALSTKDSVEMPTSEICTRESYLMLADLKNPVNGS